MSQEQDQDREFEKYLAGGSGLSNAYAELPDAEPPAYLDYAIRDEAHRVVGAYPPPGRTGIHARARTSSRSRARQKWTMPLSVAATLVIVVMVGLQLPYITGQQTAVPEAAPASEAESKGVRDESKPAVPAQPASVADLKARATAGEETRLRGNPTPTGTEPAKKRKESPSGQIESFQQRSAPAAAPPAAMEAAPMAAPLAEPAPDSRAGETGQPEAPGPWLMHIEKLRQEGRRTDAAKELAAFRKRYPHYPIPADLRELGE